MQNYIVSVRLHSLVNFKTYILKFKNIYKTHFSIRKLKSKGRLKIMVSR